MIRIVGTVVLVALGTSLALSLFAVQPPDTGYAPGASRPAPTAGGLPFSPSTTAPPFGDDPAPPHGTSLNPPPGRQGSLVSVRWVGPSLAQVGQKTDCSLVVRNTSQLTVHKVLVYAQPGAGLTVASATPKAATQSGLLVWQLGNLLPRQEKQLHLQLLVGTKGVLNPRAWVTFTGLSSASLRIQVREPKLALRVVSPPRVVAGDPAPFTFTVSNTGDCLASRVKLRASLSAGLEHARGRSVDFEVGDLAAGEARTVQMVCMARSGGPQTCEVAAETGGCVKARSGGAVNVIVPRLEVELNGPALRYVERKATFVLRVVNRGEVPASNVTVSELIPDGFKFVAAADGGRYAAAKKTISWFLGELTPGQARQVQFELVAIKAGQHRHRVTAASERGGKVEVARELTTRVEDFSALGLEIAHADDAIEVGKDTTYEVIVGNTGSRMETNVKLICALPVKMSLRSATGPTRYHQEGNVIVFEPVPRLAPRGDVVYKVKVKALVPGDVRFKIQVTSTNLIEPVIKTEATRIYSDRP